MKTRAVSMVFASALICFSLVCSTVAHADGGSPAVPSVTASNATAGHFMAIEAKGFTASESVKFALIGQQTFALGTSVAVGDGSVNVSLRVPSLAVSGKYTLIAKGVSSGKQATTTVTIKGNGKYFLVKFNPNGGRVTTTAKSVKLKAKYGSLPTPTRSGYTFTGWYTAKSGGTKVTSSTKLTSAANKTVYARWKAKSYKVTFNANGGKTPTVKTKTVTMGKTYGSLPTTTRTGYSFQGWFTAQSEGVKVASSMKFTKAANQVLYAVWKAKTYTVTLNPRSGKVTPTSITVTYDSTYKSLPTPTRAGYTFQGWYTKTSGGSQVTNSTTVKITAAQTLYAQWAEVQLVPTENPTISGTAMPGFTLTANPGKWSVPNVTLTYTWLRDGTSLDTSGYKPQFYMPTYSDLGHSITVRVTATDGASQASATSNAVLIKPPKAAVQACPSTTYKSFAAGLDFALVLTTAGDVCGWGNNGEGQLGTTTADYQASPVKVQVPQAVQIAAGGSFGGFGLALTAGGDVWSWGFNEEGQLGIQDPSALIDPQGSGSNQRIIVSFVPRKVAGLPPIASIVVANDSAVAIAKDGTVYTWGSSGAGYPTKLPGLSGIVKVATDGSRFLALTKSGSLLQWGSWLVGFQQADGSVTTCNGLQVVKNIYKTTSSDKAVPILPGQTVNDVAMTDISAAYALTSSGQVYGWGTGSVAGMNLPMIPANDCIVLDPVPFTGLPSATALYAGISGAFFAQLADHTLAYWGSATLFDITHYTSEEIPGISARRITSPDINPATIGFGAGWAGALTTAGTYFYMYYGSDTYDGYPFVTSDHPLAPTSLDSFTITQANKTGCSYISQLQASSAVPVFVTMAVDFGPAVPPYEYSYLYMPYALYIPTYGGANTNCSGTLSITVTIETASAATWAPDGKSWTKTATKAWT